MPQQRSTMVAPRGLITRPSDYSAQFPDGALARAENCLGRNLDELISAPGFYTSSVLGSTNDILYKLVPLDSGHVYEIYASGSLFHITETGNAVTLPSVITTTNALFDFTGFIDPLRMRDRILFNSVKGFLVGDSMQPASPSDRALRSAGLAQPQIAAVFDSSGTSGTIPAGMMVGYAPLMRRTFSDGYELASVAGPTMKYYNPTASGVYQSPIVRVMWSTKGGFVAGDVVELYRTDGLVATSASLDPGTYLKMIRSHTLTSADISAGYVDLQDTQPLLAPYYTTSGEELYSNPGQEGDTGSNRQPPIAKCTCYFKNYAFYGNTTDRPAWTFQLPAGFGSTFLDSSLDTVFWRTNGVGERHGAGTITAGSPTITGVSATQMLGVQAGQAWNGLGAYFPSGTRVVSVTSSTITMASNAVGNGSAWVLDDVLELNGSPILMSDLASFGSAMTSSGVLWEITSDQSFGSGTAQGVTITIEPALPSVASSFTVRGTNGGGYGPAIPDIAATAKTFSQTTIPGHLQWSKEAQPEHVPAANEDLVTTGTLYAMDAVKDYVILWCSDGPYKLQGDGGEWAIESMDHSTILCAPQASCAMKEAIYGYTNAGVVRFDDDGRSEITKLTIGDLLPGPAYSASLDVIMQPGEQEDEIYLTKGQTDNKVYIFNARSNIWTTLTGVTQVTSITAMAWQRQPGGSTTARLLIGVSPPAFQPSYAGWGNTAVNHLPMLLEAQPIYAQDPLSLKHWISQTFIFDAGSAGTRLNPGFNGVSAGFVTLGKQGVSAYGTIGVPQNFAVAHAIAPIFQEVVSQAAPLHFQGWSFLYAVAADTQAVKQ